MCVSTHACGAIWCRTTGRSLAVLDFNLDGVDDLAVGAPGESGWNVSSTANTVWPWDSQPTFRWFGKVFILLGAKGKGLPTDLGSPGVIQVWTNQTFAGLGEVLAVGDIDSDGNPDLLMGCPTVTSPQALPFAGHVYGVVSSKSRAPRAKLFIDTHAFLSIPGRAHLEFFGQAIAVVPGAGKAAPPLVLVGAPYHRPASSTCDTNQSATCLQVGRVYAYNVSATGKAITTPQFTIR